jgi:hypothetical protein
VVLIIGIFFPYKWLTGLSPRPDSESRQEVPVPGDQLIGGVAPLSPGKALELYISFPGSEGTPTPTPFPLKNLKVAAILDDKDILLAVPPDIVPTLQAALLVKDARFTYNLFLNTPTATLEPTQTDTPTTTVIPKATSTPDEGTTYLSLVLEDSKIDLQASWLVEGTAQLIVTEKRESPVLVLPGEAVATPAAVSACQAVTHTVEVKAFLDEEGGWHDAYDADESKKVLLAIDKSIWADVACSLASAETIWLVHETP